MEAWKSVEHRDENSFRYFYDKSKRDDEAVSFKKRKQSSLSSNAIKNMIDYPFIIRWYISGVKDKSMSNIFRKAFIIRCEPNHNGGILFESF